MGSAVRADEYKPPSAKKIAQTQNTLDSLRLLLAQRRLYQVAKRWLGLRWTGMILIGIVAPVVAMASPSLAVVSGAAAGVWLFAARTVMLVAQSNRALEAAFVQEQFDRRVFGMPDSGDRSSSPSREDIAKAAGPERAIQAAAEEEELLDWYPIDERVDGATTVAVAQRANASYSDSLLRTTAVWWVFAVASWIVVLLTVSVAVGLTLSEFLLGVAFPVLPGFLDLVQHVTGVRRAAFQRAELAGEIEEQLTAGGPIDPAKLLVWQERVFALRRTTPEVPDFIYKLRRKKNEAAMTSAANQLTKPRQRR